MLNIIMIASEDGSTIQHRRDKEVYQTWKKKNSSSGIILLSAMDDDIAKQFKRYENEMELWNALKELFGGVFIN